MQKIGLVLSGGGARGAAHLGVLEALNELGIHIAAISGVSAGAIVGALYAAGYAPSRIMEEMKNISYFSITDLLWGKDGLFSMHALRKKLQELIPEDSFEHLQIPLFVTATDILSGQEINISSGNLIEMLLGSSAVPAVFEPVSLNGYMLVDGGLVNNFPVSCLKDYCDIIIGSHVNKLYNGSPAKWTMFTLLEKCFHLAIAKSVYERSLLCHVFIEPDMDNYAMFDMKHADKMFEEGYKAAMGNRNVLLSMVK